MCALDFLLVFCQYCMLFAAFSCVFVLVYVASNNLSCPISRMLSLELDLMIAVRCNIFVRLL